MPSQPRELTLDLEPRNRYEIIDVAERFRQQLGDEWDAYRKVLYCSFHTTAGYFEQGFCARLGNSRKQLDPFIRLVQKIFPPEAGYLHDHMPLRDELSESQKEREPVNADSHLTFMSAGLKNCVTYLHKPGQPVYFIELDGVFKDYRRQRRTSVLAYNDEEIVHRARLPLSVGTDHQIDTFNLKDPRYGLFEQLDEWLDAYGIECGRVDLRLPPEERHARMTVNEYETLLMRQDLPEVLRDPLRFMMQRGRNLLRHPAEIPGKTRDYAAYDLIHLYNEFMDSVPLGRSVVDRVFSALANPASRILRLKRHLSLPVSARQRTGPSRILQGTYQSPILVQHHPAEKGVRYLDITLRRFK